MKSIKPLATIRSWMASSRPGHSGCQLPISCKWQAGWVIYSVCIRMIMFKPVRLLQVSSIYLLLAGCAATHTPASTPTATPAPAPETRASTSSTESPAPLVTPEPSPSIQAGRSIPGNSSFLQANGQLTDNIQTYANEVARTRGIPLEHVQALLQQAQYNATA